MKESTLAGNEDAFVKEKGAMEKSIV